LKRNLPLAINLNTEKARSELLIAPLLFELKFLHPDRVSLFSGIEFTVDISAGLSGRCDYIFSQNPQQLALTAPICVLVEAKSENIVAVIPQCLAEMVAAQQFNATEGQPEQPIYGVVTTGVLWRFMVLNGLKATVDDVEYPIQLPRKIFGVLSWMILNSVNE